MKYFKPVAYIFLSAFIITFFYISFQAQEEIDSTTQTQPVENSYKGVIAVPAQEDNQNYSGVIRESKTGDYMYSLNSKDDKVLLYLKSAKQDLALLTGLEAEVNGDISGRYNGASVMEVKSIKLK